MAHQFCLVQLMHASFVLSFGQLLPQFCLRTDVGRMAWC